MKKPVLAMFVVAAIAIGLLVVLLFGLDRVDEDGRERDGLGCRTDSVYRSGSAQVAGPSSLAPSGANREPCSGQSQLRSASFQRSTPPR
jgi:hypothetical protein